MGTAVEAVRESPAADGFTIVSDLSQLMTMRTDWNELVKACAPTPFLLVELMRAYFKPGTRGSHPLAIVMREKGRLIGIAAFQTKIQYLLEKPRLLKYRTAEFLLPDVLTPDFVVRPNHRRQFVEGVLSTLFDTVGCQTALLILPTGSPNVAVLGSWCRRRGMGVWSSITSLHPVVKVRGTWNDYQASLGRQFIREVMKSKRRLERKGQLTMIKGVVDNQAVVDKILEIDRHSWKEDWKSRRNARGIKGGDDMLEGLLDYYKNSPGSELIPKCWVMELDGKPIAFAIFTTMGKIAYLEKTSFDLRYQYFSPGTCLHLSLFQALFDSKEVTNMDFLSMHEYMRHWRPEELTREAFLIEGRKGAVGTLVKAARSRYAKMVLQKVRRASHHEEIEDE